MSLTRSLTIHGTANVALLFLVLAMTSQPMHAEEPTGNLRLTIKDAINGKTVSARLEVRGADGEYYIAEDALAVGGDCRMSEPGAGLLDDAASVAPFSDRTRVVNPYTNSSQFYSVGTSSLRLPPGRATIKVYKGPEYKVEVTSIEIASDATVQHEIELSRWINMPQKGWYSADDHLHIARPSAERNVDVSKMMQAEDVHVANLLQMGKVGDFAIAKQYAHGPESYYQEGNYILAAGQENPRTHFLGHTITLGAEKAHYNADKYLIYRLIWAETAKEGALNGFAHAIFPYGSFIAPHDGLAVVLPHKLLHFIEVLQFDRNGYDVWYDLLALGLRITPTAGTDYPCGGQVLPGHERFYTKVEGPLTYAKWLDSVRHGRTFVTTGPIVEFRVNGQDIGSDIMLEAATNVEISGSVTFDPARDDVSFIELVKNGNVIERFSRVKGAEKIKFSLRRRVDEAAWFAIRGYGVRIDELPFATPLFFGTFEPTSLVHSAPTYVSIRDRPGIEKGARAKEVARSFIARLNDLERVLAEDNVDFLAAKLENPTIDAVPKDVFLKNRPELLKEIEVAKDYFKTITQS
jgi:hypothetical protein